MKLVFFDIDGTLIDYRQRLSASTVQAIRKLRRQGNLALLNTGRPLSTIPPDVLSIGFDGVLASCGASVSFQDQKLLEATIPQAWFDYFIPKLSANQVDLWLEGPQHVYVDNLADEGYIGDGMKIMSQDREIYRSWHQETIVANKFSYHVHDPGQIALLLPELEKHFVHIRHSENMGEWLMHGYTKATGMACLLDHLGLPVDRTYAFGDSANDLDMLQYAGTGIAMGNADPRAILASNFLTGRVDEDGILHGLQHFGLI